MTMSSLVRNGQPHPAFNCLVDEAEVRGFTVSLDVGDRCELALLSVQTEPPVRALLNAYGGLDEAALACQRQLGWTS